MADYQTLSKSYYAYGVQISKLDSYKIITQKYNFVRKAEAILWAVRMVHKGQYATIIKYPNKYYKNASRSVASDSLYVISYERGDVVGTVRKDSLGYPRFVDDSEDYMYFISPKGVPIRKARSIWDDPAKR